MSKRSNIKTRLALLSILVAPIALSNGCAPPPEQAVSFEKNRVFKQVVNIREDGEFEPFLKSTDRLLEQWFGTPDEPKLPPLFSAEDSDYKDLISLDNLKMAAGPAPNQAEPGSTGLYRQQCASCHGETGQGRGVVAASQDPYPRDFRKGIFKYKTSNRNAKPTREDLHRTLVDGLTGTQMPKFNQLSKAQLDAIIDYVIYLSIRGELERTLVDAAAFDLEEGQPLYDVSKIGTTFGEDQETYTQEVYDEQLEDAADSLSEIADAWVEAADEVEEPEEPENSVVTGAEDIDAAELAASIERGKALFATDTAACSKCHGTSGRGDGKQVPDYDDWTKEWTTQINVNPNEPKEVLPFLNEGALPPKPLKPRNLVEGNFRGGRDPNAVYHRIVYGIAGTPMPAAARSQGEGTQGLSNDDIWDLVNYVLSLKDNPPAETTTTPEVAPAGA